MRGDYLAILGEGPTAEAMRRNTAGLQMVFESSWLAVLTEAGSAAVPLGDSGVVLGPLFDNSSQAAPIDHFEPGQARSIVDSAGQWLLNHAWGGYLALVVGPGESKVHVLRDPSGAMPAYWIRHEGLTLFCSSLELAIAAGLPRPSLDWSSVGQILAYPQLRGARTGLRGVDELLPGTRATVGLDHSATSTMAWSPWSFAGRDAAFDDPRDAATAVREAVDRSVRAWASVSEPLILELSGGLDSSIIAAGLTGTAAATFVNFHTLAAEADERRYARQAAMAGGRELVERRVDPQGVDVRRARPGRHPRPASQALLQPIEQAFEQIGRESRVAAYFSGLGGDNVFCSIATAAPAADALLAFGPGRRFLTALGDLSALHQATLWDVARLAVRKTLRPRPHLGVVPVEDLLSPGVRPALPDHPWTKAPRSVLPGKQEHVASVLVAQGFLDRYEHAALAPVRFPLLSQPVLEACLRVPTWMAISGGRNRALARDAFLGRLPPQLLQRQTKSGLNVFMGAVFEQNRAALTEQLARGWLVTAGLADGPAIRRVLETPVPTGLEMVRVMYFADVEAWARTWGQT